MCRATCSGSTPVGRVLGGQRRRRPSIGPGSSSPVDGDPGRTQAAGRPHPRVVEAQRQPGHRRVVPDDQHASSSSGSTPSDRSSESSRPAVVEIGLDVRRRSASRCPRRSSRHADRHLVPGPAGTRRRRAEHRRPARCPATASQRPGQPCVGVAARRSGRGRCHASCRTARPCAWRMITSTRIGHAASLCPWRATPRVVPVTQRRRPRRQSAGLRYQLHASESYGCCEHRGRRIRATATARLLLDATAIDRVVRQDAMPTYQDTTDGERCAGVSAASPLSKSSACARHGH